MKNTPFSTDDCIAALATPKGESALAVIRTSGKNAISQASKVFRPSERLSRAGANTMQYGFLIEPETENRIDEVMAGVFRSPKSYTGEDSVEFYCHGSMPAVKRILNALFDAGFRQAEPGEFTLRAFLNGKMDLTRAEAVHEIIRAKSVRAQAYAFERLGGAVETRIRGFRDKLMEELSVFEIQLDYAEDEVEAPEPSSEGLHALKKEIDMLLATYRTGTIYQEGVRVVLAGRTNAGKSSLFNLLLKKDRSIVSDLHGTTRDFIESWITIKGIPCRLYDTAGLRTKADSIEQEGMRRSRNMIEEADVVVLLVDALEGIGEHEKKLLMDHPKAETASGGEPDSGAKPDAGGRDETIRQDGIDVPVRKIIAVWNKTDLTDKTAPSGFIPLSTITGQGFSRLEEAIAGAALGKGESSEDDVLIDSERQKRLLEQAADFISRGATGIDDGLALDMVAVELREALHVLGEITGEVTSEEMLRNMFSRFCVGK